MRVIIMLSGSHSTSKIEQQGTGWKWRRPLGRAQQAGLSWHFLLREMAGEANGAKINGVAWASIAKINGVG